jgi:hypothetical protein
MTTETKPESLGSIRDAFMYEAAFAFEDLVKAIKSGDDGEATVTIQVAPRMVEWIRSNA